MKFLSIDTSTNYSVVALLNEDGLIYGARRLFKKGRTDSLITLINHCLTKANLKIKDIDYFGVGVGPGSFTGLRIGLSTIKGFSYALSKPCLIFSSLDAIAFNRASYLRGRLCVMVDARRSNVYCRFYNIHKPKGSGFKKITRISKDALMATGALWKEFETDTAFSGDALNLYKEELKGKTHSPKSIEADFQYMPQKFWYPTPESLSFLTLESFRKGEGLNCFELSAVYLYEKDCQVHRRC